MLSPGDKVRNYEVIAPIRSGGMAVLYLARRRGVGGFSRLVALKMVHAHLTDDPDITRLFLQEARFAASIAHPNVVHVEEIGSSEGKYFIAMEYVHGVSLDELLSCLTKQGLRLSPNLAVWVAAQLSEALHAVHEATQEDGAPLDIVHRDVSPQNVLIGQNGHVKLIDFGIAKSQSMNHDASSRGSVMGKLRYMAPEQLCSAPVTRRTDVYALGVMLWEMLASRHLLRCERLDDERDWTTRENPPPPSRFAGSLKPALDQAVLRAIACDASQRFETALLFRSALLRAEPSAAKVDSPAVAALLHKVLGEELERRRAHWPSEVNVQLESDVVRDTDLALEELTLRRKPAEASDSDEEDLEGPTLPDTPPDDQAEDETVVEKMNAFGPRSRLRAPSIQAQIPTVATSPSDAQPRGRFSLRVQALARTLGIRSTPRAALLSALLAFAVASVARLYSRSAVAAGSPRVAKIEAPRASAPPPVTLPKTIIASESEPEQPPPEARALPAPAKRTQSATRTPKKKPKPPLGIRNRRLRRK